MFNKLLLQTSQQLQHILGDSALRDIALQLDEAIDRYTAARTAEMRDAGTLNGFAFTSDESPPSANRYCGLRFQITYVYIPIFKAPSEWERHTDTFPFNLERHLTDIVHCPSKRGDDVLKVMEKQWFTKGLTRWDAQNGTGDRGGENMGKAGIHSIMEASNESYTGKICCAHLSWRVCDAGIRATRGSRDAVSRRASRVAPSLQPHVGGP